MVVFLLFILGFSFWMTKNDVPELLPLIFVLSAVFFGAFISSFFCKKRLRQQGIVPILIAFAAFLAPVLLTLLACNLFSVSLSILAVIPAAFTGALAGGFIASKLR